MSWAETMLARFTGQIARAEAAVEEERREEYARHRDNYRRLWDQSNEAHKNGRWGLSWNLARESGKAEVQADAFAKAKPGGKGWLHNARPEAKS